jgi:phospholipase C
MANLDSIRTIIVVMMENRSFDHMLGYLTLDPCNRTDVEGQSIDPNWLKQFTNFVGGYAITPFLGTDPHSLPDDFDPPHERNNIAAQIDPRQDASYPMNGFVHAIPPSVTVDPAIRKLVMSYFGKEQVPMNDFLAQNFTICDHWFCSLPAGTQPNRLMSMSGISMIDVNQTPLPDQTLVYDWLNQHKISWRVYHQGIPFFALMPKWIPAILFDDHFRSFDRLGPDLLNTPPEQLPQVIFVEPTYQDAPHIGASTDDHAPQGVSNGQEFLMQVYNAVIANPPLWKSSLTIIDYDEHGGFFDHVVPPDMTTNPPPGARWTVPFTTLGVRTPAYLISPFVPRKAVSHNLLDHTSVLKLFGEKFGNGSYSPEVDSRPVGSLSHVLDFSDPQWDPPAPPALDAYLQRRPPQPVGVTTPTPDTGLKQGFSGALETMKQHGADASHPKFGALLA